MELLYLSGISVQELDVQIKHISVNEVSVCAVILRIQTALNTQSAAVFSNLGSL